MPLTQGHQDPPMGGARSRARTRWPDGARRLDSVLPAGRWRTALQTGVPTMTNIVTTLLDFILALLRDPPTAAESNVAPHPALASARLTGVTADDVNAALPMVADCSPVRDWQASYA